MLLNPCTTPDGMHAHAPGPKPVLLVVHEDRELPLEDVERVGVAAVEVRPGARAGAWVARLRDAELVERPLDHDPAAEERLALAGSVHDACHGQLVAERSGSAANSRSTSSTSSR